MFKTLNEMLYRLWASDPVLTILVTVGVFGIGHIFWEWISLAHLATAFTFFIIGLLVVWGIGKKRELSENIVVVFIPIILGLIGWFVEFWRVWKVPVSVTGLTLFGNFSFDITMDTILIGIVAVCCLLEVATNDRIRRKLRR